MDEYIKELNKLINKSKLIDDIPITAIVVKNNTIIGRGYNKKINTNNITDHAEILAIKQASKKLRNWRLIDCDIYTTMFPCPMCASAIQQSRIRNIYYFNDCTDINIKKISMNILNNNKLNHKCSIFKIENKNIEKVITNFFDIKRNNNVSRETSK